MHLHFFAAYLGKLSEMHEVLKTALMMLWEEHTILCGFLSSNWETLDHRLSFQVIRPQVVHERCEYEGGPKNNRKVHVVRELEVVTRCATRCRESTQYSSSLSRGVSLG